MKLNFILQLLVVLVTSLTVLADSTVTEWVYIDYLVDGTPFGRALIGLYGNDVPLTATNFKSLAQGWTNEEGTYATYVGSSAFYIGANYILQGDYENDDGTGGKSIYGTTFPPETASNPLNVRGTVAMIADANGNIGSQFMITTSATPRYKGKQVVVGTVIEGFDVIDSIAVYARGSDANHPSKVVSIASCGVVKL